MYFEFFKRHRRPNLPGDWRLPHGNYVPGRGEEAGNLVDGDTPTRVARWSFTTASAVC